ncbi:MAG: hypothetical protein ACE5KK_04375, partial [Candidatus Brocadiales bacterium]
MKLVLLASLLLFLTSLSVTEGIAQETKEGPAAKETKKSVKALEQTSAQEATQENIPKAPPEAKKEVAPLAKESETAEELGKDTPLPPEKVEGVPSEASEEAKKQPVVKKRVKKSPPPPKTKPKVAEGKEAESLFSVE